MTANTFQIAVICKTLPPCMCSPGAQWSEIVLVVSSDRKFCHSNKHSHVWKSEVAKRSRVKVCWWKWLALAAFHGEGYTLRFVCRENKSSQVIWKLVLIWYHVGVLCIFAHFTLEQTKWNAFNQPQYVFFFHCSNFVWHFLCKSAQGHIEPLHGGRHRHKGCLGLKTSVKSHTFSQFSQEKVSIFLRVCVFCCSDKPSKCVPAPHLGNNTVCACVLTCLCVHSGDEPHALFQSGLIWSDVRSWAPLAPPLPTPLSGPWRFLLGGEKRSKRWHSAALPLIPL